MERSSGKIMLNNNIIRFLYNDNRIVSIALGGSRSRGKATPRSDYDYFCIIKDGEFSLFFKEFSNTLAEIEGVKYSVYCFYYDNFGYIFKAIDEDGIYYDIIILPAHRIKEMSIRSTNIIIKDTDDFLKNEILLAHDEDFEIPTLETERFSDYIKLFFLEYHTFLKSMKNNDYWHGVRCLEQMKSYYIRCQRIQSGNYPVKRSCPEKQYTEDSLQKIFIIDGSKESLMSTASSLLDKFMNTIHEKTYIEKCRLLWEQN